MNHEALLTAMRRLKVETGSLACLGCGYEHDCGAKGCAILREGITHMTWQQAQIRKLKRGLEARSGAAMGGQHL